MAVMVSLFVAERAVFLFCGMAVQVGSLQIRGTIAGICFYRMYGRYYARRKSSLTGKRVKRDPVFAKTMYYAGLLGKASKIASERYKRMVPKEERSRKKYRELVGIVMLELQQEKVIKNQAEKHNPGILYNKYKSIEWRKMMATNCTDLHKWEWPLILQMGYNKNYFHGGTDVEGGKDGPRITRIYTDGDDHSVYKWPLLKNVATEARR